VNTINIELGAIQIIRHTFLAYFYPPPSPMCHLVTLARPLPTCDVTIFILQKHCFLKTFEVKISSKMNKQMKRDILVDPLRLRDPS